MPWMKFESSRSGAPAISRFGQPAEELAEHHRDLAPREVRAEAVVRAGAAEADVLVRRAARRRSGRGRSNDVLVAVRRVVPEHDLLARARSSGRASSVSRVAVRRKWITGVAQRTISSTAGRRDAVEVRCPERALVGEVGERLHAVADRVARGLVAGHDEQHEERRRAPASVSVSPSTSAFTSAEVRSSPGLPRAVLRRAPAPAARAPAPALSSAGMICAGRCSPYSGSPAPRMMFVRSKTNWSGSRGCPSCRR